MQVDWRNKWLAVPYQGLIKVLQGVPSSLPRRLLLHIESLPAQDPTDSTPSPLSLAVQELIREFQDLFEEPNSLPPSRECDHEILLIPGAQPVFIRPYRYPPKLKDEIECQVQEMMDHGLIRRSSSAFSSPVLLMKKKDGTYRFCVDF